MADYFGTSINESPTIVLEAGKDIEGAQGIALAIKNGKAEKPTAGANVIGLSLFTNDEKVKAGDDVDIQVKDIENGLPERQLRLKMSLQPMQRERQ